MLTIFCVDWKTGSEARQQMCANANKQRADRIHARLTHRGKLFPLWRSAFRMWARHMLRATSDAACETETLPKTRLWMKVEEGACWAADFPVNHHFSCFHHSRDVERFSGSTITRTEVLRTFSRQPLAMCSGVEHQCGTTTEDVWLKNPADGLFLVCRGRREGKQLAC